jgi:hypothetical protein
MPDFGSAGQGAASGASFGATFGPWGAVAGGVVGGIAGMFLGDQAAEAKKKAALESVRRRDLGNAETLGQTAADAAASGVDASPGSGSAATYLATMGQEFRREHDWAVEQANKGASLDETANVLGGLSSIGSSLFRFGQSQNWFQK